MGYFSRKARFEGFYAVENFNLISLFVGFILRSDGGNFGLQFFDFHLQIGNLFADGLKILASNLDKLLARTKKYK